MQHIKKKFCPDDLVNAVVIGVKSGILLPLQRETEFKALRCDGGIVISFPAS